MFVLKKHLLNLQDWIIKNFGDPSIYNDLKTNSHIINDELSYLHATIVDNSDIQSYLDIYTNKSIEERTGDEQIYIDILSGIYKLHKLRENPLIEDCESFNNSTMQKYLYTCTLSQHLSIVMYINYCGKKIPIGIILIRLDGTEKMQFSDRIKNSQIYVQHAYTRFVEIVLSHIRIRWIQLIETSNTTGFWNTLSSLCFMHTLCCPYARGSAAILEILVEALLQYKKFQLIHKHNKNCNERECIAVKLLDLEVFSNPCYLNFVDQFTVI